MFNYKECKTIPAFTFVDDTLAFATSGTELVKLNAKIKSKFESKRLELGFENVSKCIMVLNLY